MADAAGRHRTRTRPASELDHAIALLDRRCRCPERAGPRWPTGADRAGRRPVAAADPTTGPSAIDSAGPRRPHRRGALPGWVPVRDRRQAVDLTPLRPRARALLRLLALSPNRDVHREHLVDALWPGVDLTVGTRRLQVAVSSVRQLVEQAGLSGGEVLVRHGDAYRLALPAGRGRRHARRSNAALREADAAAGRGDTWPRRRPGVRRCPGTGATCCRRTVRPSTWSASGTGCGCWRPAPRPPWPRSTGAWVSSGRRWPPPGSRCSWTGIRTWPGNCWPTCTGTPGTTARRPGPGGTTPPLRPNWNSSSIRP